MNELAIIFKEIEVADCYFEHEISLIPFQEGYFTESGDSEEFFETLKKMVCDFIDKIVTSIIEVFEKFFTGKTVKKAEENLKKNPKLKDEKTKITDWKKVHVLNKETQKKIQNAKSKEEVDQIMKEYKSKRNKILAATAAVTVTVGGLLLFLKKGKSKTVSNMEEQKQGMNYERPVSTPKNETPATPAATKVEETKKAKATADAEIRKTEVKDSADEVKECITKVNESTLISDAQAADLMKKMNGSAIKLPSDKKYKGFDPTKVKMPPAPDPNISNTLNRMSKRVSALQNMLSNEDDMRRNKANKESVKEDLLEMLNEAKSYAKGGNKIEAYSLITQIKYALKDL